MKTAIRKITSLLLLSVMIMGLFTVPASVPAYAAGEAENYPLNSIVIKIEDIITHQMLGGARFEIYYSNDAMSGGYGTLIATVDSDGSGVIVLSGIPSGYYIVRQTVPPNNYHLAIQNEQHCFIKPDGTSIEELVFSNYRYGGLVVILNDKDTGKPISGATFSVTDVSNKAVGHHADGIYTTDSRGEFFLENLPAGDYKITQLTAAQGYALDSNPSTRTVRLQHTNADQSVFMAQFSNSPLGTLIVRLKDSVSKEPLSGAKFNVKLSGGADLGEFTTGANGSFSLPRIERGSYIISQVSAPSGYLMANTPKTQYVNYVNTYAVDFENQPKSGLYVTKYDKDTKTPLKDAKFNVYQENTLIGSYTTNAEGVFFIPNLNPGWYTVSEFAAPQGYILDDTPKSVQVIAETLHRIEFENSKLASLQIIKTDEFNGEPLAGAKFRVTTQNGEFVADVTTDGSGKAVIPALAPGWYVISETKAPNGYLVTEAARTVEVKSTVPTVVTITNRAENNLEIVKLDFFTRTPLSGATFKIEHANGANVGTFNTDSGGKILVGNLKEGAYVISEIKAPDGYQLDAEPQTIVIEGGRLHSVEFLDKPLTAIEIVKIDSVSKLPLAGAAFKVEKPSGEVVGTYKTDVSGKAIVSGLESGTYIVSETDAPDGYILHETPKTVVVTSGKVTTVEFTNKPYSGIQIVKTDSVTYEPLANATFRINRPNGELIGVYKTDVSGKAIISDLAEGTYIVSETIAPSGYMLTETPKTVTVVSGKLTIAEFTNDPYGSLVIKKIDEITEKPLIGARFTVKNQGGEIVGENYTTGAEGSIAISDLKPGWYVVSETRAPDGYTLDSTAKTIEVKPHIPTTITFTNRPHSGIQIIKTDSLSEVPLQGAVFTVQKSNGDKVGDKHTTDVAGKIIIPDLPEGVYIITEIQAPAEYILDALPKTVEVKSGKLTVAEFTNTPFPYLHIVKTNAATGQLISGAEFTVANNKSEVIANVTSQASGAVSLKVAPGVYTVTEVKAPAGYELHDPIQTVEVRADGSAVYYGTSNAYPSNTASFANRPLNAIEIVKLDAITKNPLAGAIFTIDKSNGERVGAFMTDSSGMVLLSGLTEGTYIIGETSAPKSYILDEIPQTINVSGGKLVSVMFLNKPLSGIQITKIDAVTKQPLKDASFSVAKSNGESIGTFRTEADGTVLIPNLDEGVYVIGEISAPNGYQLDETPKNVTVVSGRLAAVEFTNKPYSGIQITKTDAVTGVPLAGASFSVERAAGTKIGTYKTDTAGKILVTDLAEGSYIVSETSAPNGYVLDNAPKTVTVVSGRLVSVEFTNAPYGSLIIKKTDEITGRPLAGAHFTVKHQNGSAIGDFITDTDGAIAVPSLEPGWYVVSETKAPNGYHLDSAAKTIEVKSHAPVSVTFTNRPYSGIEIVKTDSVTKVPLAGASFTVEKSNGEKIGTYKTDSAGKILVPDLAEGSYIISETSAPNGYVLDNTPKTVTVVSGRLVSVEFANAPYGSLIIKKTDEITGRPLAGAHFTVKHQNGAQVGDFITDTDGSIAVPNLEPGWYVVSETKAPNGYHLDSAAKTIEVKSHTPVSVTFTNRAFSGIEIVKTDSVSHVPLSGATFVVERSNGERIGSYKTDAAGKIIIPDLAEGVYVVSETIAPDGYMLNETPKNVTVVSGKLATVEFANKPYSGVQILKTNAVSNAPLQGAVFTIQRTSGERVGDKYTTDIAGKIIIPDLPEGVYIISEVQAPKEYVLDAQPQTVEVKSGRMTIAEFTNTPFPYLHIKKTDAATGGLVAGADFTVTNQNGEIIANVTSLATGAVSLKIAPGVYTITEVKAPAGYELNDPVQTVEVKANGSAVNHSTGTVIAGNTATFANRKLNTIEIVKLDAVTKNPLSNAMFTVDKANGERLGSFRTDSSGKILIPDVTEGTYVISEIAAPTGYILNESPKSINVSGGKLVSVEFLNKPLSGIQIVKLDAVSHQPLQGAKFSVTKANGEVIGNFTTEADGKVLISNLDEGVYVVGEITAPDGYQLDEAPKNVTVTSGKLATVEFVNKPYSGIEIIKLDAISHAPLAGAGFVIERTNGEKIGSYKTDITGKIIAPNLQEGTYIVSESAAPDGYVRDEVPKTVEVKSGKLTTVEFTNKPFSGIQIIKLDAQSKAPLPGASFVVERTNGERVGSYKTDSTGKIIVNDLTNGTYIVSEIAAPDGYILDEAPKTVEVKSGRITTVEFLNKPLAGLRIVKLDSVTRNPIEGVEFSINAMNGERVENDFRSYNFKTDKTGQIYIPDLADGYYVVMETRSADGYILDGEPKTVLVQSGKVTVYEVLNTPMSGLLIVKTDSVTGKPLPGAVYDVRRADGQFVAGNILDGNQPNTANNSANKTTSPNGDITGSYTTDANGRIQINGLDAGQYNVTERKAPDGYELDAQVYNVTVVPGKLATLQLKNTPLGGIRITKVDSLTKKPIYNVEFMLFDMSNKVVGVYYTDNNGRIDFPTDIPAGRYTIRETRAANGYFLDETPKTIEFTAGAVTEIVWENTPQMGQIQILKKSGDDNEVNGFEAGTPLAGAVFEVYHQKTGNLVDRFVSGNDGRAVSSPLPLGRYIVKEVQAPAYYKVSDKELDITIEFATEIVRHEFLNYSANTGVAIKKTGNAEAMPGDTIRYDIKEVRNTGTVPLTDFFWRDVLPVDAVRLNKIVTGTYNQALKYKILATTNKGNTIIVADNLSTAKNNVIDCSPASLGLKSDEFVTTFTLVFGTVKAGFAQVETPQIYVDVLKTLNNGYKFANKVDVGGKYGGEWVIGNSTVPTAIYSNQKLPKTGY